jgi:hypothetical protein
VAEHGWTLEGGYRAVVFAEQSAISADQVVELWTREAGLPPAEARRRISELLLVATRRGEGPVALTTAYLRHNEQLRMDVWYLRGFVARRHRGGALALGMARLSRDLLRDRFVSGADTRGAGVLGEVQNEGLKRAFNQAVWPRLDLVFIGENARGDHVRVHPFPGAVAPPPPRS